MLFNKPKTTYKILFADGAIIEGTPKGVASVLRKTSWQESNLTTRRYIRNFAKRYHERTGNTLRTDSYQNFIYDLVRTSHVIKWEEIQPSKEQ